METVSSKLKTTLRTYFKFIVLNVHVLADDVDRLSLKMSDCCQICHLGKCIPGIEAPSDRDLCLHT